MSGFEVIGVVLGAIPIVIEAYDRVAPRISAYRHYRSKVDLLVTKAMSQRTIFRNSARGLVSAINNDRQTLEDWLAEQEPQELEPSRLSCLRQGLHEDLEHCIRLVNLIHASLSSIEHEVACLDMKHPTPTRNASVSIDTGSRWTRLKFAIKSQNKDLLEALSQLKSCNEDFTTIVTGCIKAIGLVLSGPHKAPRKRKSKDINTIERFKNIRSASDVLYQTMESRWACSTHQRHSVSVSYVDNVQGSSNVKFDIALSSSLGVPATLWLETEVLTDISASASEPPADTAAVSSVLSCIGDVIDQRAAQKKQAHFDVSFGHPKPASSSAAPASTNAPLVRSSTSRRQAISDLPTDLVLIQDLCDYFHKLSQNHSAAQRDCLGAMKGHCIQKFYPLPLERQYKGTALSLAEMIEWVREEHANLGVLDTPLVIEIAASLAMAVLCFHSTPWLRETWQSDEIKFFNRGKLSRYEQLSPSRPCFQVELDRASSAGTTESQSVAHDLTPSELPFHFGITLLELGLSRTWETLKEEGYRVFPLSAGRRTDHHVAMEWWKKLKSLRRVGSTYLRITHDCIRWDFSLDVVDDENSEEGDRQIIFFFWVVGEMEKLTRGWFDPFREPSGLPL